MINLKRFLKLRDEKPEFKEIKAAGRVGLPCIVINDGEKIIFDHNLIDLEDVKNK
jgi:glutaredoxin-related protein